MKITKAELREAKKAAWDEGYRASLLQAKGIWRHNVRNPYLDPDLIKRLARKDS